MLNAFLSRWKQRASRLDGQAGEDTIPTAPPPQARAADSSLLQSLLRWLPGESDPWGGQDDPSRPTAHLPQVRAGFIACLQGLEGVDELQRCIQRAGSLRDFWHLRGWLYTEVARSFSQHEAETRLAALAEYFPSQAAAALQPARRH